MSDWDMVVIGGGPAGLTAAAAAVGTGLSCMVIDPMGGGGALMNLGALHEVAEDIAGPDLAARLLEEAVTAGAALVIGEVAGLVLDGDTWHVVTDDEPHVARTIILATGLAPGTLGLDNEDGFEGRGLSHCAACDGPLFRGQPVVVAGADRWARQEAQELAATASVVTLITQGDAAPAVSDRLAVIDGRIVALEGAAGLDTVLVQPAAGGAPLRVPAEAVFVQTGRRAALHFAPETLVRDADGRVITDAALQTSLPRVFAAGDVRAGCPRTLAAAMEEGRLAARSAHAALSPLGKGAD